MQLKIQYNHIGFRKFVFIRLRRDQAKLYCQRTKDMPGDAVIAPPDLEGRGRCKPGLHPDGERGATGGCDGTELVR